MSLKDNSMMGCYKKKYLTLLPFTGLAFILIYWYIVIESENTLLDEHIFYALMGKTFYSDVYVWYPNGNIECISPESDGIYYEAHINMQGTKVVFFGNNIGTPRIWIADLVKETVTPLTPQTYDARQPVFSWDGSLIAFSSGKAHDQDLERIEFMHGNGLPPVNSFQNIYIMDTEGGNLRQVTYGQHQDQRPTFSPDGETIVFASDRNGEKLRLWSVSVDGQSSPQPLQEKGYGYRPWFSPAGDRVYFFTKTNRRHQVGFITLHNRQISLMMNDDLGYSHGPFVDPSTDTLLMHSTRSGKFEIWELPLNGEKPVKCQPPGFEEALHATRSENGIVAFDAPRISRFRKIVSNIKNTTKRIIN